MISRVLLATGLLSAQAADSSSSYDKYMKNYGGGSQGGSQSGNYQQYMKKYTGGQGGDYQQYMKKYAGGQGGDYQQYMKKYAGGQGGDYQQYMKKYGGGSQGGSQSGDYQQYMKKYAGGQGGHDQSADTLNLAEDATGSSSGSSQGNYQQYMNKYAGGYEKYFDKYTNNNGGGQGGNYQQYMQKYTGGQGGNYQQYMQKYTGGSQSAEGAATPSTELIEQPPKGSDSTDTLNLAAMDATSHKAATDGAGSQGNYQQYMDKYAGSYEKYMKQYAGQYQKYQNYQQNKECESAGKVPSAHDAKTKEELDEWYTKAQEQVKCFVPDAYSTYASKDLDKKYKTHLAELENSAGGAQDSPITAQDAVEDLIEKPKVEKTQSATKHFLAQTEKLTKEAEHKAEVVQSKFAANVALFADQVKSDPATVVGASLVGTAFACFVFFTVLYRRSVQLPVAQLG